MPRILLLRPMLLFAAIAVAGSLWVVHHNPFVRGGDPASYCLEARYHPLLNQFDNPAHNWGYPLAIKIVSAVTGDEFRAGQAISIICSALYMALAALFCFGTLPRSLAWLACALLAVHPIVLQAGGTAMTDMLFGALLYASLWLCFHAEAGVVSCGLAGIGVLLAMDVRGNGLAALLVIPLLLLRRPGPLPGPLPRWKQAVAFAAGAAGAWMAQAAVFAGLGIPKSQWSRPGAGEIAFAALEKSDGFSHNLYWNHAYTSYVTLATDHRLELLRAAITSLAHFHDWMLVPQMQLLGFFVVPGLFLWFRRASHHFGAAAWCVLAVVATFTWHFHFQDGRYLLVALPVLVVASLSGLAVIPQRIRLFPTLRKVPLRAPILFVAVAITLGFSAYRQIHPSDYLRRFDVAQYHAGLWLATQKPGLSERIAVSRMTVAYYGRVFPVDLRRVFDVDAPFSEDQVAAALHQHDCQWLVWIVGHSELDHPQLAWLAQEEALPGCDLVYRRDGVSIWKVR